MTDRHRRQPRFVASPVRPPADVGRRLRHGVAAVRPAPVRQRAAVPVPGQGGRDFRRQRRWRCTRRQLRHPVPEGLQQDRHGIGLRQEAVHTAGQAPRPDIVPDREVFADHFRLRYTRHAGRRLRDGAQVQRGVLHQQWLKGTARDPYRTNDKTTTISIIDCIFFISGV